LKHLEHMVSNYNVRHVHFEDDNLTMNIPRFEAILEGVWRDNWESFGTPLTVSGLIA
jgi:hypothetical protein